MLYNFDLIYTNNEVKMSIFVALCGGSASGKTQAVEYLKQYLSPNILHISQDCYYKDMSHLTLEERANYNFDHPNCIENDLLIEDLYKLKSNEAIYIPSYSYLNSKRSYPSLPVFSKPIILIDGLFLFAHKELLNLFDYKIFIDTNEQVRIKRCIDRDVKERGMTITGVKDQIKRFKIPMHNTYVEPFKHLADSVIVNHLNDIDSLERSCEEIIKKVQGNKNNNTSQKESKLIQSFI